MTDDLMDILNNISLLIRYDKYNDYYDLEKQLLHYIINLIKVVEK